MSPTDLRKALTHIKMLVFGEREVFDDEGHLKSVEDSVAIVLENDDDRAAIEELHNEIRQLRTLVYRDELTGLLNRRGVMDEFTNLFDEALFSKEHPDKRTRVVIADFSVIFIDADNFKSINDTYGHDEGDRALKAIATVLKKHTRGIDAVGRLGGEEFVVGLLGASEDDATEKAEKIRASIETIKVAKDRTLTASIGVASLRQAQATTLQELIDCADKAMYEAKTKRGKNTVVRYSELAS